MARAVRGKRIEDYNYVCTLSGRTGDYVRIGKPGPIHTRVALANLTGRTITDESILVASGDVRNLRSFATAMAAVLPATSPPPPAHNIGRYDDEVKAVVQAEAVPLEDTFNSALRRLLGIDPPRVNPNGPSPVV